MKKVLGVVMLAVFLLTNTAVVTVSAQEQNKEDNNENQVNEQILEFKAKEKIYSEILKSNETIDLSDIYIVIMIVLVIMNGEKI